MANELLQVLVTCIEGADDKDVDQMILDLQDYEGDNKFLNHVRNMGLDIVRYERMEEYYKAARAASLVGDKPHDAEV